MSYVTTLPNILRQYSPDLYGYAIGSNNARINFIDLPNTRLNVAQTGAKTFQMLSQATAIVRKIRENEEIDFENDWKMITIYIGGNDLCTFTCQNNSLSDPDVQIANLTTALDYLKANLPRTFVNVVQLYDVVKLARDVNSTSQGFCTIFLRHICPCFFAIEDQVAEINRQYQQNLEELIASGRYDNSDDFTVVLQPFLSTTILEETAAGDFDLSSLALDCVHLSTSGNRDFAIGLWNNMFERVGEKNNITRLPGGSEITCPTNEQPFFFTARNSSELIRHIL